MSTTSLSTAPKLREVISFRFTFGHAARPPHASQCPTISLRPVHRSFKVQACSTSRLPLFGLLVP